MTRETCDFGLFTWIVLFGPFEVIFGHLWSFLVIFGHFRSFLVILANFFPEKEQFWPFYQISGFRIDKTLKIVSSPIITHKTSSSIDKTLKIVSSPKITHKTCSSIENTFKLDCSPRISLKIVSRVIFTFENEFSHKILYKMCCSVFSRHCWVKKRVSGSK